jgi:hypothetical protein
MGRDEHRATSHARRAAQAAPMKRGAACISEARALVEMGVRSVLAAIRLWMTSTRLTTHAPHAAEDPAPNRPDPWLCEALAPDSANGLSTAGTPRQRPSLTGVPHVLYAFVDPPLPLALPRAQRRARLLTHPPFRPVCLLTAPPPDRRPGRRARPPARGRASAAAPAPRHLTGSRPPPPPPPAPPRAARRAPPYW